MGKPISNDGRHGLKGLHHAGFVLEGIKAAWPICLGYLPLGFAFGVLAQKAGLDLLDIALMSILVYAGSSQFIAVAMISGAAAPVSIILTTFVVNLRHLLMSSSLAVHLHGEILRVRALSYLKFEQLFEVFFQESNLLILS